MSRTDEVPVRRQASDAESVIVSSEVHAGSTHNVERDAAARRRSACSLSLAFLCFAISIGSRGFAHGEARAQPAVGCARNAFGPTIVIGFVGGFVHRIDARHIEVQLAQKLRARCPDEVWAAAFENRNRKLAHQAVLTWLDTDRDGKLSDTEKSRARIILYGHSWGGSAVLSLARELQQESIPVLLTVQVDSIERNGQDDRVVPANVHRAINFYQTHKPLRGRRRIVAEDPSQTEILGNFRLDYDEEPKECAAYPWYDRHVFKWHTAIECDPRVWSQIEALINAQLLTPANPQSAEAVLTPRNN